MMNLLLAIAAGYTVYKIGWVDGFTATNIFLLLCFGILCVASLIRRSSYGKIIREKREEAERAAEEKKKGR